MDRDSWKADMKRLGLQWHSLPKKAQDSYKERSRQEFQRQRAALRKRGMRLRADLAMPPKQLRGQSQRSERSKRSEQSNNLCKIGEYTVAKDSANNGLLGEGSYGAVYLCFNQLQRLCAVKVFKKHVEDLMHEAMILTKLQDEVSQPIRLGTSTMRFAEYVTNLYRAPELWDLQSTKELTTCLKPAVDMWSYGCVVFEVCTLLNLHDGLAIKTAVATGNFEAVSHAAHTQRVDDFSYPLAHGFLMVNA
eukprot:Skav230922  [mRNA]  locus=scaffold3487:16909:19885:+ [translate_table: standard]